MIRATALALILIADALPAAAGLQRWSVIYLDAAGQPTSRGAAASVEIHASDARGFQVAIGCGTDGGHVIALGAPEGGKPDFAGPSIEPGIRISRPGTDLFSGSLSMSFDGRRYAGPLPETVLAPLRTKIRDGILMLTELGTHTTVKLELQSIERALAEVTCK